MRLLVAPGDGRLFKVGAMIGFCGERCAPLEELLFAGPSGADLTQELIRLVVAQDFDLPPWVLVDLPRRSILLFGEIEVQAGESVIRGSAAIPAEHPLSDDATGVSCLAAATADGTDLREGVVSAGGFALSWTPDDVPPAPAEEPIATWSGLDASQQSPAPAAAAPATAPPTERTGDVEPESAGSTPRVAPVADPTSPDPGAESTPPSEDDVDPGEADKWFQDRSESALAALGDRVHDDLPTFPDALEPDPEPDRDLPTGEDPPETSAPMPIGPDVLWIVADDGSKLPVVPPGMWVGRNPDAGDRPDGWSSFRLSGEHVSRAHFQLRVDGGDIYITDLQSTSGTRLQRPGEAEQPLEPGVEHLVEANTRILVADRSADIRRLTASGTDA